MSVTDKYRPVLEMGQRLGAKDVSVKEENGKLVIVGTVHSPKEKIELWNKIKEIGGENPSDIMADIRMETDQWEGSQNAGGAGAGGASNSQRTYTVKPGDTLSKISKEVYGEPNRYMEIFNANKDKLNDPDKIQPGQELVIPEGGGGASSR